MREQLVNILSKIIEGGVILLVFLLPLFFLPITTDSFEFPKQMLIFFIVSFLAFIWVIKMILEKSVKFLHSPLTLPVLIFLIVVLISMIFSVHRFSSIFGSYPRLHGGLVSQFFYFLTFFLIVSNIKGKKQISRVLTAVSLSGFILAIIGILHFFDIYPLGDILRSRFVTPIGSADRTSLFLAVLLPLPLLAFFFNRKNIALIFSGILSVFFVFYIFLISLFPAILSVFLIFLLALLFSKLKPSKDQILKMGVVFLFCLFLLAINNWGFVRNNIPGLKDRIITHDIAIDQNTAWAITIGGFQNLKLLTLGSGPGTYLFDFSTFRPVRFNQTPLWNLRFEKSSNEYFHLASTIGLLGLISFIYILISAIRLGREFLGKVSLRGSVRNERKENLEKEMRQSQTETDENDLTGLGIFAAIAIVIFISFFTTSSTAIALLFWVFLALMIASFHSFNLLGIREIDPSFNVIQQRGLPEVKRGILPWIIGFVALLILVPLFFQITKIFRAELYFANAQAEQRRGQPNPNIILESLRMAVDTMPNNDAYRRSRSATALNFAILTKGEELEEIRQQLLQLAVKEGETAVMLAPRNIFNIENIQRIYTTLAIDRNDEILINTILPQEILLDPANPRHWNDLGWVYFNIRNDSDSARWYFQKAISLKPDFTDAHYNLARVYREEGKTERALQEYNQTLNFLDQQIGSLERISSQRQDIQRTLNQLVQSREQIEIEKNQIQWGVEIEEVIEEEEEGVEEEGE